MALNVIGVGVGRTGTFSLRMAIEQLGFGPCHHMEVVLKNIDSQVPLWLDALAGNPQWNTIYSGFKSAVDWPTAGYYRELIEEYPTARFILTDRDPVTWAESFGSTIYKLLEERDKTPEKIQYWLNMANDVISKSGFPQGLDKQGLVDGFIAHNEAVKKTIPEEQLLTFQVKNGWAPLCDFLDVPVPNEPFPRTNNRAEFWELVKGGK